MIISFWFKRDWAPWQWLKGTFILQCSNSFTMKRIKGLKAHFHLRLGSYIISGSPSLNTSWLMPTNGCHEGPININLNLTQKIEVQNFTLARVSTFRTLVHYLMPMLMGCFIPIYLQCRMHPNWQYILLACPWRPYFRHCISLITTSVQILCDVCID